MINFPLFHLAQLQLKAESMLNSAESVVDKGVIVIIRGVLQLSRDDPPSERESNIRLSGQDSLLIVAAILYISSSASTLESDLRGNSDDYRPRPIA